MEVNQIQLEKIKERAWRALFHNVFGTILPLFIGTIILVLVSKYCELVSFIYDGTFCLFSAGLLTSAKYIMDENITLVREKWDRRLINYSQPLLYLVALVFGFLFAKDELGFNAKINNSFLWAVSIIPFVIAVWFLYRALIVEGRANPPQIDPVKGNRDAVDAMIDTLN